MRLPYAVLLALVLILLAGCGGGDGGSRETTGSATTAAGTTTVTAEDDPYAYDASEPVRLRDLGRANDRSQLQVRDVVFAGAEGNAVTGYLLTPPGKGPFPAVVYLHGAGGSRADFVGIASWIVARGAVALAIDSPFVREQPQGTGIDGLRSEHDLAVRGVVDARRAVDALQTLPQVDDDRIGLVGFSAGARSAAILAGVEPRFRTVVLWSGGVEPVSAYTERLPTDLRLQAGSLLSDVDPLRFVDDAKAPLLFQAGRRDDVVPRPALQRLYAAASEPKELRWYPAGHQLNAKAYADHLDWLTKHLEVDGPVIPGLETAPS